MQDISFHHVVQLQAPAARLVSCLMLMFPGCHQLRCRDTMAGGVEVSAMLHSAAQGGDLGQAIAPVQFTVQSLSAAQPNRMCWVWIHPAAAAAAAATISTAAAANDVMFEDVTSQLQRLRVRGAMSTQALARALRPHFPEAPADSAAAAASSFFSRWWDSCMLEANGGVSQALQLVPDGAVVAWDFEDPRGSMPQQIRANRQVSSSSSSSGSSSSSDFVPWHPSLSLSNLWSLEHRKAMFENKETTGLCFLYLITCAASASR